MKLKPFSFFLSFLVSLTFYDCHPVGTSSSLRNLVVTEDDINDICQGAEWDAYQIDNAVSLSFYSKTFNTLTKPQEYLLYLIQTEDLTKLKDYVISFAPLIIFVAFAYVTMILWMIYIACAKYPRLCFKRQKEFVPTGKGKLFFILLHGCFAIVLICSIFGYIYSNQFSSYITSATCAFLSAFNDFNQGQPRNTNNTIAPTWIGVNHMEEAIYNTLRSIDQMRIVTNNIFLNSDWAQVDPVIFDKEMINLELNYSRSTLPTPNPQNERTTITPYYLMRYSSSTSGVSYMRAIQVEYEKKIRDGTTSISNLRKSLFTLKNNYEEIKTKFNNINIFMKSMQYYFDQINDTLLTEWVKYFKMANVGFHVFFLFLFAFQTVCAVVQIVFFYLLHRFRKQRKKLQIVINVFWNAYAFSLIFSFMSGFGFIVTSYASVDSLHVLSFIFGKENLLADEPFIISNSTIGSYIYTCLHSDGNLANNLQLTNTVADSLNVIYSASYILRNTKQILYKDPTSRAIPRFYKYVDSYKNDIHRVTNASHGTNDVSYVFNEWSKYTSSHFHDYQSLCESGTLDQWVGLKTHCPNNYTYIEKTTTSIMDKGNKRCLVYDEWTKDDLQKRYRRACELKEETPGSKVKFYSSTNASEHYLDNLLILKEQNNALILDIVNTFEGFEKFFNQMSTKLLDNIIEVEPLINISYNSYHDLIGDNEMYSMMNCRYFQGYFSKLYYYLNDMVSPTAMYMGIFMIVNSVFGFLSLIFLFYSKAEYIPWEENDETLGLISSRTPHDENNSKDSEKLAHTIITRNIKQKPVDEKIEDGEYLDIDDKLILRENIVHKRKSNKENIMNKRKSNNENIMNKRKSNNENIMNKRKSNNEDQMISYSDQICEKDYNEDFEEDDLDLYKNQ